MHEGVLMGLLVTGREADTGTKGSRVNGLLKR